MEVLVILTIRVLVALIIKVQITSTDGVLITEVLVGLIKELEVSIEMLLIILVELRIKGRTILEEVLEGMRISIEALTILEEMVHLSIGVDLIVEII